MIAEMDYSKIDQDIRDKVYQELCSNQLTFRNTIRIGVLNAVVHLAGEASDLETWNKIQRVAEKIPGVRGVVNRIEAPGAPEPTRRIDLQLKPYQAEDES